MLKPRYAHQKAFEAQCSGQEISLYLDWYLKTSGNRLNHLLNEVTEPGPLTNFAEWQRCQRLIIPVDEE